MVPKWRSLIKLEKLTINNNTGIVKNESLFIMNKHIKNMNYYSIRSFNAILIVRPLPIFYIIVIIFFSSRTTKKKQRNSLKTS